MRVWLYLLLLSAGPLLAQPKHMRVIVDTSESLCRNPGTDRSGNLKLASALLYDLARKSMAVGDTFKYSFFDSGWGKPAAGLPSSMGPEITPPGTSAGSQSFLRKLMEQPYNAPQTYFAPGFRRAFEDLTSPQIPGNALKVIVLLTDGLSDIPSADQEALRTLSGQLRGAGIKVFVLSFHSDIAQAKAAARFLEEALDVGLSGPAGAVTATAPENLLDAVMEVFCRSFGWGKELVDPSRGLPFSLTGGADLPRAAVVALYRGAIQGNFQLHAGKQNQGQIEDRVSGRAAVCRQPVSETPNSYSIAWVSRPLQQEHTFEPLHGQRPFEIAILRPLQVRLSFHRASEFKPSTMETRALKLEALAALENQPKGDLRGIDLEMRVAYRANSVSGAEEWVEDQQPGQGAIQATPTNDGYVVLFTKTISRNSNCTPVSPAACAASAYPARVRVVAKRAGIEVSQTIEELVTVYPFLQITVDPATVILEDSSSRSVLSAGKRGAAFFKLVFRGGLRREGDFVLAARLAEDVKMDGPLRGARFHLDGEHLEASPPGYWTATKTHPWSSLAENTVGHRFTVEVQTGRPARGTLPTDKPLVLRLGLWDKKTNDYKDYDDFIEPVILQVQIAEPGFWTTWGPVIGLVLSLLSLPLLWLLMRKRGGVPPDLQVEVGGATESATAFSVSPVPPPSPWSRWLAWAEDRPVLDRTGSATLGRLRPLRDGLYEFVPADPAARVSRPESGSPALEESESYSLECGRTYQIDLPGKSSHRLRIQYSEERPLL